MQLSRTVSTGSTTASWSKSTPTTPTRRLTRTSTGRRDRKECSLHSPDVRVTSTPPYAAQSYSPHWVGYGFVEQEQADKKVNRNIDRRRERVGSVPTSTRCLSYRRRRGAGGGEDRDLCLTQPGHTQTLSVSCVKEQDTIREYSDIKCSLSWRNKTQ